MPKTTKKVRKEIEVDSEKVLPCRYLTRSRAKKIKEDSFKNNGHTGPRGCSKTPEVSRKEEEIGSEAKSSIRPAVRRAISPTMPKLIRSPAIITHPVVEGTAAQPSSETRALQAVTLDHEKRLQVVESSLKMMNNHVTQLLPAQMVKMLDHSNNELENIRQQIVLESQDLRARIADLSDAVLQRPLIHFVEVGDYYDDVGDDDIC